MAELLPRPWLLLGLAMLWLGWCGLHSLLISHAARRWFDRRLGARSAYFRLAYNIFSLVTLVLLLFWQFSLQTECLFDWSGTWRVLQLVMLAAATFLFVSGARADDMAYFVGFRQIRSQRQQSQLLAPMPFTVRGILHYVRHPWYAGGLLFVWSAGAVTDISLVMKTILCLYLLLGCWLEEGKLVREIGRPYQEYQRRVNMLLPWPRTRDDS